MRACVRACFLSLLSCCESSCVLVCISLRRELKKLKKQSFNYYRADPISTVLENVQLDEAHRMDELIEATKVWLEEEGSDMLRDAARDILQLY